MSKHISRGTLSCVVALSCIAVCLPSHLFAQASTREKVAEIVEAEAGFDLFSGTVLFAESGKIVYAEGFGEANKEYHIPNVLETRFNISSVQKTFVATLVMQLVQEGVVDLDDPLPKYYPQCPWDTADHIRIRHLLNHTSGLGDYRDSDEYRRNSESYTCIDDVLPLLFATQPAFAPGERFRYANAGVLLLKGIIEQTTGEGLGQALEMRIWQPLGMDQTVLFVGGDVLERRASAYRLAGNGDTYRRVLGEPSAYSGGGIYTTVLDLLKFDQALYGDALLDEDTRNIMFTPVEASPHYAYGWEIAEVNETKVIYHGGGSGGFNSEFRRYPDKGYTLIVLSNYPDGAVLLADRIERTLLGLAYSVATESDMYFRRGMHCQQMEDYATAIALFERSCSGDTPHLPSLYQAARSRILSETDQERAIELLDRYIELADESTRPQPAAAWWRKGVAHEQMGNTEQAIACYRESLELDPGFAYAQEAFERLEAD